MFNRTIKECIIYEGEEGHLSWLQSTLLAIGIKSRIDCVLPSSAESNSVLAVPAKYEMQARSVASEYISRAKKLLLDVNVREVGVGRVETEAETERV